MPHLYTLFFINWQICVYSYFISYSGRVRESPFHWIIRKYKMISRLNVQSTDRSFPLKKQNWL
jgi:hypothetical protein